jgi:hypothetical protein
VLCKFCYQQNPTNITYFVTNVGQFTITEKYSMTGADTIICSADIQNIMATGNPKQVKSLARRVAIKTRTYTS